jgi:phosphohistidine phosphatase
VEIYLVRHAVAYTRDAERWPDDGRRPLTPRGEEYFRRAARGMGEVAPTVDVLLSSPFDRAWRTAEILAEETSWPEPEPFPALEPEVPPEKVLIALEAYADLGSLALVGHRPGLHELASFLIAGDAHGAEIKIKKGGAVLLRVEGRPGPGTAQLLRLLTPKDLRRTTDSR